jgi:hypothetical protein
MNGFVLLLDIFYFAEMDRQSIFNAEANTFSEKCRQVKIFLRPRVFRYDLINATKSLDLFRMSRISV